MTKFFSLLALFALSGVANGFVVAPSNNKPSIVGLAAKGDVMDEIDFDAPSTRADAVGNAIHSPEAKIGPIPIPHFIAKAFGLTDRGVVDELDPDLFIDEECYLGKNGDLSECADFDPKP